MEGDTRIITVRSLLKRNWKTFIGIIIPLLFLPLALSSAHEARCAYVLCVMASYWVLEPIPLAVTALLPIALFPMLGVLSTEQASTPYMKSANALFFGGLLMAIAIEGSNLHKRVAFSVLLLVGCSIKRIMFGLMLTTMFLSMWISNTATTAMMVPVVDAMVSELHDNYKKRSSPGKEENIMMTGKDDMMSSRQQIVEEIVVDDSTNFDQDFTILRRALLLSVAYSANIGGTGTITGTGTNIVLQNLIEDKYPGNEIITFAKWLGYAFPGALICVLIAWLFLVLFYIRNRSSQYNFPDFGATSQLLYRYKNDNQIALKHLLRQRFKELGPMTFHELAVIFFFLLLVLLWFFRAPGFIPGWNSLISTKVSDGTPAILIGVILFFVPTSLQQFVGPQKETIKTVLDWPTVQKRMPWGVFLLLGGGFSLAEATEKSQLSHWLSQQLSSLPIAYPAILVILLTVIAAFITEIASNVATASVILPIVNKTAIDLKVNPLMFLVPVTISVSFAFMFPVATPPNAIVYEHLAMRPIEMMKPGIVMNIICISVALILIYSWGFVIFDLSSFPEWAQNSLNTTSL